MDERTPGMLVVSLFRGIRLALHLLYGMFLAVFYPHLNPTRQHRILKAWSRQLLGILNIGIYTEGLLPTRGEGGRMLIANHISWLDIFILNATCPSRFIAKSEVRDWPLIGWLCKRSGTIFIERDLRRNAASINRQVGTLLEQGVCIGLFPEGTTTDGKQLGHFHSALIQPAIDAGAMLYPIALHYRNEDGEPEHAAVFTGDTTLVQSIWEILRCRRLDALLVFAPALIATNGNRRVLARTAQEIIAQGLQQDIATTQQMLKRQATSAIPQAPLPAQPQCCSLDRSW